MMTQLGLYVGNSVASLERAENWLGRDVDNVLFYLNNDSWRDFDSSIGWAAGLWRPTETPVIWSVPLTVWGTPLDQVANGDHDAHFLQAARTLAQSRPSSDGAIYVRLGWEFNGDWMPWAARGHEAAFIEAFQNVVSIFRSVSGDFRFVWDVNASGGNLNPTRAYPGDGFVDVVGLDVYYNTMWDSRDPLRAFDEKLSEKYGLEWQRDFADAHGKPIAISEWGVQTDNSGPFIRAMADWLGDNDVVFANYWDTNAAGFNGQLHDGQHPNVAAAFREAFASSPTPSPTAATSLSADPGSPDTLVLRVSADSWWGDPHFVVSVDGRSVGGVLTTQASHASGQVQAITLTGDFGGGPHDVSVAFINDAYGGSSSADRNLYVHQVELNGQAATGDTARNHAGYNSHGVANLYDQGHVGWLFE